MDVDVDEAVLTLDAANSASRSLCKALNIESTASNIVILPL